MIIFKSASALSQYLQEKRTNGSSVGFVPTMGALHAGHISLIKEARSGSAITVCSIFVNPTQFNNATDFQLYPITIEQDIYLLEKAACDILFLPSVDEIYPGGLDNPPHYELGNLEHILEGEFRPGHFQGVCQVVDRLLNIVQPSGLYMGQKDYQQCMVIQRLLELTGKTESTQLQISVTRREATGLAMSSRNMRLKAEEKLKAAAIYRCLATIKEQMPVHSVSALQQNAIAVLTSQGFKVDYIEIRDAVTLEPIHTWDGHQKMVALAAAFLGGVRLIDNLLLN